MRHETGWTEENVSTDEYKFILSGEEFESPALKAGALRMFAKVPYIASWWQREFHSAEGKILHRETSFEPDPAQVTDGQRVYLNFKAGTAEIR